MNVMNHPPVGYLKVMFFKRARKGGVCACGEDAIVIKFPDKCITHERQEGIEGAECLAWGVVRVGHDPFQHGDTGALVVEVGGGKGAGRFPIHSEPCEAGEAVLRNGIPPMPPPPSLEFRVYGGGVWAEEDGCGGHDV